MLKLVKLDKSYKRQLFEMMDEWTTTGEKIVPYAIRKVDYKNFDKYLESLEVKENENNGLVPDSTFFCLDTDRNIFVGAVNIRHYINDDLLLHSGHIGDGIRPSERRKGYATKMISLALEECRKLGIKRVLMVCYKDNIGSRKSIINNGGVLENEISADNGKIDQRYWISLKKKFADSFNKFGNVLEAEQRIKSINERDFKGDIYLNIFNKVTTPFLLDNGLCIQDTNYKWLEFYDYNSKVRLSAVYDENNKIVEWYFDVARCIGKEKGIPYEDDLYLDVVLTPSGKVILLDEDELKEAFERKEMTKEEFEEAYQIANELMEKVKGNADKVLKFTDKYLDEML